MPDHFENFWPDDLVQLSDPEPIAFLKEQAAYLGEKTQKRVTGTVRHNVINNEVYYSLYLNYFSKQSDISISEQLYGFADDYGFKILSVSHPLIRNAADPFPLQAQDSFGNPKVSLSNMDEFRTWLKGVLSSKSVINVIGNLLRAAKS